MSNLVAAILTVLAAGAGSVAETPMVRFFKAADAGDFETMASLVMVRPGGPSGAEQLKEVKGCYLGSMVWGEDRNSGAAMWICAKGPNEHAKYVYLLEGKPTSVDVDLRSVEKVRGPAPVRKGSVYRKPPNE